MIHDRLNIWLLRPGIAGFSTLPELLDDTDTRSGAEQLGERWMQMEERWQLEGSALHGNSGTYELLGAIRLVAANELVMVFERGFLAIVASGSRQFTVARLEFEVSGPTLTESRPNKSGTRESKKQRHSFQPEVFFNRDWHGSGNRFATEAEAEAFVANLRATWIPQGFIKRDRVQIIREPPNAFLNWKTKQSEQMPEAGASETDKNDGEAA